MPDINRSQFLFSVEGDAIRFGFAAIRDVGRAAEDIVAEREKGEFKTFRGFINRTVLHEQEDARRPHPRGLLRQPGP